MARLYGPGPGDPPALISTADLAGLSTADVEGSPVGELVGALSEDRTGLIRYLDIDIRGADRHVLVPIGHARIDRESVPPRVRLRAATRDDLLEVPAFREEGTDVDADYHNAVMRVHGRLFYGSRYYAHPAYDHGALQAGDSPIIQVDGAAAEAEETGVRPLSSLRGFQLARGAPDLVGWTVVDRAGERAGEIEELLVEPSARRVRYAVIHLARPDRPTAIPIGYIELDREAGEVRTPALSEEDLRLLPAYEAPMTREEENRLHAALEGRLTGDRYFERADFRP